MNTVGYIVLCGGRPMYLAKESGRPRGRYGTLYFGAPPRATLFTSRARARGAIKRTNEDRVEHNGLTFEQEFGECAVYRVEREGERPARRALPTGKGERR
jgi:hypothetical protein